MSWGYLLLSLVSIKAGAEAAGVGVSGLGVTCGCLCKLSAKAGVEAAEFDVSGLGLHVVVYGLCEGWCRGCRSWCQWVGVTCGCLWSL